MSSEQLRSLRVWVSALRQHDLLGRGGRGLRSFCRSVFGDRTGVTLFLGALTFYGLAWRFGFFIDDNFTLANALVGLSDGHLYVDEIVYGPARGTTPGMHVVDGRLYGRNFGQLFYALPFFWALSAASAVADPRIVLVAGWSLATLAFFVQFGRVVGRAEVFAPVGSFVALVAFFGNVVVAQPLDEVWVPFGALQLSTMVAAGLIGVVVYRLVTETSDRQVGVAAGVAVAIASPVGFWATIPKRHTVSTLLVLLTVYCFYRSRAASSHGEFTTFRALAYVWVAQASWTHAPEGFVLFVALGAVDVLTARSNGPRDLAILGAAFALALLPMFLTNWLVAGDPTAVPRTLPRFEGSIGTVQGASGDAGRGVNGSLQAGDGSPIAGFVGFVTTTVALFVSRLQRGISRLLDSKELFHVFVRSGNIPVVTDNEAAGTINLSVLESMPLVGLVAAAPLALYDRLRARGTLSEFARTPERATELLVGSYVVLLFLIYIPSLPLRAMITVRYLHPLYPLAILLLARLPVVRRTVRRAGGTLLFAYVGSVLVGGQLLVLVLYVSEATVGEAVQLHALVALSAAALLVCWGVAATLADGYYRVGAVALGFAAAVTTTFLLLSTFQYFEYASDWALPLARVLADALPSLEGSVPSFIG